MNLPKTVFPFIFYFVRQQWIKFSIVIFASIIWGTNNALFPYLLKRLINVLGAHDMSPVARHEALIKVIVVMICLWVSVNVLLRIQGFLLSTHVLAKFRASIREALFN